MTRKHAWIYVCARKAWPLATVLMLTVFLPLGLRAQERATIVGTVVDPSGAIVPGAHVTITNTATSVSRVVETNSSGNYIAPELPIGTYTVRVELKGFKTYERQGIVLNVNDALRVDVQMEVGEVTQSVTVTEAAVKVQTESSEVSDVVSGRQIQELAMNGRNFFELATLVPGASSLMPDFNLPIPVMSSGAISFNGLRPDHNMWMIDGGEDYDRGCGGCVTVMPSMDALAEFTVQTSNYGPSFGLSSSATVNMALKSGTQSFHGTLWEFMRNDALDANNFFANLSGTAKPPLRLNIFGWNLGGPFYIPHHYNTDKRKTFFFFNQEWRRIRQGTEIFAPAIPNAERTGDFSSMLTGIKDASGNDTGAIFVPQPLPGQTLPSGLVAGQPFPGNIIPNSVIDPNAAELGKPNFILPLPNTSNGEFYSSAPSVPINVREETIRVDQTLTDKLQLMAHFLNDSVLDTTPTSLWSSSTYPSVGTIFKNPAKHAVLKLTWTINPTLVNELSGNYDGNRIFLTPTGTYTMPSGIGHVGHIFPGDPFNRIPGIGLYGPVFSVDYDVSSWPWTNANDNMILRDEVSKMAGSHALSFGGELMRSRKRQELFGDTQGAYDFNGTYTASPYAGGSSGNEFADFLLGRAYSFNELALQDEGNWRFWSYTLHLNDSWRVTRRLTLQLGVRWEILPHTYDKFNRQSDWYPALFNFADAQTPAADDTLNPNGAGFQTVSGLPLDTIIPGIRFYMNGVGLAGKNGIPRGLVDNHYDTIGPRVGFAYDIFGNGKTVLRGGFGQFFERVQGNDVYDAAPNTPFSYSPSIYNTTLTNTGGGQLIYPASMWALSREYKLPTTNQYSFGLQHELWPQGVLSVEYVGTTAIHQNIDRDINQPAMNNPLRGQVSNVDAVRPFEGFSSISYIENSISSTYNSLQVNFHTRNYHGMTFQTAYTWSHAIDIGATGEFAGVVNNYNILADRGSSDYDRRQMLILNYVYDLPFFRHTSSGVLRQSLGGWELSGITTFQSGTPFSVYAPGDPAGIGASVRSNVVGNPNNGPKNATTYFNPNAFAAVNPVGVDGSDGFGDAGRNDVWGAGRNQWDIDLFKNFTHIPIHTQEGATLQFRAEFFNAFNHTQFNGFFNTYGATGFGGANGSHDPRVIQFGLKFLF